MLDGNPVNGFCIVSVYYCSPSGVTADQTAPSGFVNAVSNPGGCDYNACMGTSCQENFCMDAQGDCSNCP
jgi:hypothetical protein